MRCTSVAASERSERPQPCSAPARGAANEPPDAKRASGNPGSATFGCQREQKLCSIRPVVIPRSFEVLAKALFVSTVSLAALAACNGVAAVQPVSPQAQQVRVEESDPPAGATPLGELEVTHGQGCSFTGDQGTREGATALLREAAAQRGANFVKVTQVIEPYSGHDCVHREFKMQGLSYRLAGTSAVAPGVAAAAAPAPLSAPVVAVGTPAAPLACEPPCSPGYACEAGICRALCNPACGAGQVCRADRVCVPASAAARGSGEQ
jgi:hypothetical protein